MLDDYLPNKRPQSRKHPRQARSRMTVEDILEAAAQLLVAEERSALTTIRVAERAGVSVGTLYQYFSDLDAIVAKLVEVHLDREREAMEAVLREAPATHLPELIDQLVDAFIGVFAEHPELSGALYGEIRRAPWRPELEELGQATTSAIAHVLQERSNEVRPADPSLAAFVIVNAIDALAQRAAAQRPKDVEAGTVAQEAKRLARRYLLLDPKA
jgi:AcrR family transcriptional regulator